MNEQSEQIIQPHTLHDEIWDKIQEILNEPDPDKRVFLRQELAITMGYYQYELDHREEERDALRDRKWESPLSRALRWCVGIIKCRGIDNAPPEIQKQFAIAESLVRMNALFSQAFGWGIKEDELIDAANNNEIEFTAPVKWELELYRGFDIYEDRKEVIIDINCFEDWHFTFTGGNSGTISIPEEDLVKCILGMGEIRYYSEQEIKQIDAMPKPEVPQ